jgi:hypothetical protein
MSRLARRRAAVAAATLLVIATAAVASASTPDTTYRGQAIGTIRSIDRDESVVTMADGLRLRASDPEVLQALREGDLVKVDFAHVSGGWVIRSIEGADADDGSPDTDD